MRAYAQIRAARLNTTLEPLADLASSFNMAATTGLVVVVGCGGLRGSFFVNHNLPPYPKARITRIDTDHTEEQPATIGNAQGGGRRAGRRVLLRM